MTEKDKINQISHRSFETHIVELLKNKNFQRVMITLMTLILSFLFIRGAAYPKKYRILESQPSDFDITAPRDIENTLLTKKNAEDASDRVPPVMVDILNTESEKNIDDFFQWIKDSKAAIDKNLSDKDIGIKSPNYKESLEIEIEAEVTSLYAKFASIKLLITKEATRYMLSRSDLSNTKFESFEVEIRALLKNIFKEEITKESLDSKITKVQAQLDASKEIDNSLKNIGKLIFKIYIKPNKQIDQDSTNRMRVSIFDDVTKNKKVIIKSGDRIINKGEIATVDKIKVLGELNLLEADVFDVKLSGGVVILIALLGLILALFVRRFSKSVFTSRNDFLLLCIIILMTLMVAWAMLIFDLPSLAIPIFIAPMLISILLDLRLAIIINLILATAITVMAKGDFSFMIVAVIGGTFSGFIVEKANQRSKLSVAGIILAAINAVVYIGISLVRGNSELLLQNSLIAFLNGIISIIITVGTLPFWESLFNLITPLKLVELSNPNQPLIKKLLMEAPGTYHHSLLVGNLAEVGTEAVGGNSLLARVGSYYHDIGKIMRPNLFKENQLMDNPHDLMSPGLSSQVITAHTKDGMALAIKYKLPQAVIDIVEQHHGTTLVAYFYHKAAKFSEGEQIDQKDFRYKGPRPMSKEAAVVMLADSIEAAVRSIPEKSEGKVNSVVNKIIKDKLDDGQLDLCELTLKDLNEISKAFMQVLSGYFHERAQYPEEKGHLMRDKDKTQDPLEVAIKEQTSQKERQPTQRMGATEIFQKSVDSGTLDGTTKTENSEILKTDNQHKQE